MAAAVIQNQLIAHCTYRYRCLQHHCRPILSQSQQTVAIQSDQVTGAADGHPNHFRLQRLHKRSKGGGGNEAPDQ